MRLTALFLALTLPTLALATPPEATITVSGDGVVAVAPDMATIRLDVVTEARAAATALDANSAEMADVLAFLAAQDIAPRDIQTTGLALDPIWSDRKLSSVPAVITGYRVSNGVTLRLRDLDRLGAVLDAVVKEGANRFGGLSFGLQDAATATDEARRRAVADARQKAETYAAAAGVALGPVVTIGDNGGFVAPMETRMQIAASDSNSVPIAAGEVSVRASVSITWALAP